MTEAKMETVDIAMEADEVKEVKGRLHVAFLDQLDTSTSNAAEEERRFATIPQINFTTLTLEELKDIALKEAQSPFKSKDEIDILFRGQVITSNGTSTLQHLKINPNNIVTVIRKFSRTVKTLPKEEKKFTTAELQQVSMALRTGFLESSFMKTIKKISQPEMLENLIAIAPQLAYDSTGLAIIQTPIMIVFYSEMEALQKLANERPWVIDAFNYIAAAIHQERQGSGASASGMSRLQDFLRGEEVDMDDDEDMSSGNNTPRTSSSTAVRRPRPTQSQPNVISREFVEQAIRSALPASASLGSPFAAFGSPQASGGPSTNASAFAPVNENRPSTAPTSVTPNQGGIPFSAFQSALSSSMQSNPLPTATSGAVSSDIMARAIMQAVNNLPQEAREAQLNFLRGRIQQMSGASTSPFPNPQPVASTPSSNAGTGTASGSGDYQRQLAEMRELGITDERLARQALRVADGDVGVASELILSGWNGEGAEDEAGGQQ